MNTNFTLYVKKEGSKELLSDMFKHSITYDNSDTGAYNSIIEPDIDALIVFQHSLCDLGNKIRTTSFNQAIDYIQYNLIPFVRAVGMHYDHITDRYTTGTWGVRYHQLQDMLDLLNIVDIPFCTGKIINWYDTTWKIKSFTVTSYDLWLDLEPVERNVNGFKANLSWKNLLDGDYKDMEFKE